jgi:hypothetical protein
MLETNKPVQTYVYANTHTQYWNLSPTGMRSKVDILLPPQYHGLKYQYFNDGTKEYISQGRHN